MKLTQALFFCFYNVAYGVFSLIFLPHFCLRARQAENPNDLIRQRLGIFPLKSRKQRGVEQVFWIHAVSVGEVLTVRPFIQKLADQFPKAQMVLTTVTPTGQKIAQSLENDRVTVLYFPFDWTFSVRRFLRQIQPSVLLLAETEVWPNLLHETSKASIPVMVVNARLSERSFSRYQRFAFLFKPFFQSLSAVLAQTERDAERFKRLGVLEKNVSVMGNMKFDTAGPRPESIETAEQVRIKWNLQDRKNLWIAGSTHPGEEKKLLEVFKNLKQKYSQLQLLIAPRHVERSPEILKLAQSVGFKSRLASDESGPFEILILDQLGVLSQLYAFAHIVFMGGSLVPKGGQNPIEPAYFQCAILYGPFVSNFESTYQALSQEKASICVQDPTDLRKTMTRLLDEPIECQRLGAAAQRVIQQFQGSTQRQLNYFLQFMNHYQKERNEHAECCEELFSPSRGRV